MIGKVGSNDCGSQRYCEPVNFQSSRNEWESQQGSSPPRVRIAYVATTRARDLAS